MAYMPREDNWDTLAEQKLKTFDSLTHYMFSLCFNK